nr:DUF664 domain-containing protein [Actinomycetota bacterium]
MDKRYGTPVAGQEKEVLVGFLDHYRQTILDICEGLTEEQLRRPMVPSGTSLLGMVKHLAYAEEGWFHEGVGNGTLTTISSGVYWTSSRRDWRRAERESSSRWSYVTRPSRLG